LEVEFLEGSKRLPVRALLLGERIDLRSFERSERPGLSSSMVRVGRRGCAVVFRYGVVVSFGVETPEEEEFRASLASHVTGPFASPEREEGELEIDAGREERVGEDGAIRLRKVSAERLQVVADVLAKSVVLAHYERRIAEVFDHIEPIASELRGQGRNGSHGRQLLRQIGDVLLMEHNMVGRVEVGEKPELLWERPDLEHLYARLQKEYELHPRERALERKLSLISRTAETSLDRIQTDRSLRVEWYIVILIVVEIVIILYDMLGR
jgi:uncharacterized Rmd1/YagE family protein